MIKLPSTELGQAQPEIVLKTNRPMVYSASKVGESIGNDYLCQILWNDYVKSRE